MQTFVLLPFFLFSRVPSDADTWRYGPEYNFVAEGKLNTSLMNSFDISPTCLYGSFKCRPRDTDTLNCRFDAVNASAGSEKPSSVQLEFLKEPFDIKFDRRGVQSLVVLQQNLIYLNLIRSYASQLNFGVELLNKSDGAFNATESSYLGQFESLVNVFHEENNRTLEQDYEIVPMTGFQKKQGEVIVIEKTKNLNHIMSSRSRIEISDTGFESYTENWMDKTDGNTWFRDEIRLNLVSVLPAEEALEPMSENATTVGLAMYS